MKIIFEYHIKFFNCIQNFKEIEFIDGRLSREFPKLLKPLSVKLLLLEKYFIDSVLNNF